MQGFESLHLRQSQTGRVLPCLFYYMYISEESIMKKVTIIGAAIVDVLVRPAEPEVFKTGSYAAQQIGRASCRERV